jgi:hypothetical protein
MLYTLHDDNAGQIDNRHADVQTLRALPAQRTRARARLLRALPAACGC